MIIKKMIVYYLIQQLNFGRMRNGDILMMFYRTIKIESFLMGVSIEEVRERYTDQIIDQPEEVNEEETEQAENVLSFRPK
jgi:hypothetical protein